MAPGSAEAQGLRCSGPRKSNPARIVRGSGRPIVRPALPLRSAHHHINAPAAALSADKPGAPFRDRRLRPSALGHLGQVRLDLRETMRGEPCSGSLRHAARRLQFCSLNLNVSYQKLTERSLRVPSERSREEEKCAMFPGRSQYSRWLFHCRRFPSSRQAKALARNTRVARSTILKRVQLLPTRKNVVSKPTRDGSLTFRTITTGV